MRIGREDGFDRYDGGRGFAAVIGYWVTGYWQSRFGGRRTVVRDLCFRMVLSPRLRPGQSKVA